MSAAFDEWWGREGRHGNPFDLRRAFAAGQAQTTEVKTSADPINAMRRIGELLNHAAAAAAILRDTGPVDGRFEASQLIAAIGDADEIRRDLLLIYREQT